MRTNCGFFATETRMVTFCCNVLRDFACGHAWESCSAVSQAWPAKLARESMDDAVQATRLIGELIDLRLKPDRIFCLTLIDDREYQRRGHAHAPDVAGVGQLREAQLNKRFGGARE